MPAIKRGPSPDDFDQLGIDCTGFCTAQFGNPLFFAAIVDLFESSRAH